jgi:uncharacterized membrane protein YdbT with pleckstrin-like domain
LLTATQKARQCYAPAGFSGFCDWLLAQARQFRRHARHVVMVVMTMMDGELHLYETYRVTCMLSN